MQYIQGSSRQWLAVDRRLGGGSHDCGEPRWESKECPTRLQPNFKVIWISRVHGKAKAGLLN